MCSKPPNEYRSGGAANSGCCFVPATKAAIFAFTNIETHSRASKDSEQPSFHAILCLPAHIVCSTQRLAFFKSSSWIARRTLTALSSSHRQIKTSGNREIYYPSSARAVKFDCKGIVFFMKCELSGIQAIAKMEGTAGIGAVPTAFLWLRSAKSSGQRGPAERNRPCPGYDPGAGLRHGLALQWPCSSRSEQQEEQVAAAAADQKRLKLENPVWALCAQRLETLVGVSRAGGGMGQRARHVPQVPGVGGYP
jgi:hypothetical protein